jgi:threonine dehydratase
MFSVEPSPLTPSRNNLFVKAEFMQGIGSFKVGCYLDMIRIAQENPDMSELVFMAASAGNHAQGVARGAEILREQGINASAIIYMPEGTPEIKVSAVLARGAEARLVPGTVAEALTEAQAQPGFFIHPYDSPGVVLGNGRIGYEILQQLPETDLVFVPVGGGGLAAGVSMAIKQHRPDVNVIGVQLEGANAAAQSFYSGDVQTLNSVNTLSDGTAVKQPGSLAMEYLNRYLDGVVTVSNADLGAALAAAQEMYIGEDQLTLEPAGALSLAAALKMEREVPEMNGLNIVTVASGQNADPERVRLLISAHEARERARGVIGRSAIDRTLHIMNGHITK